MNEYITTGLLLPLAMGLAGAALYHLLGLACRQVFGRCGMSYDAYERRVDWLIKRVNQGWDGFVGVLNVGGENHEALRAADATANVRLTALEERMGKVEEQLEPTPLRLTNSTLPFFHPYPGVMEWLNAIDMHEIPPPRVTPTPANIPVVHRHPCSAGRPRPKPTKDLRPGDEVSVRVRVNELTETGVRLATHNIYGHQTFDELDKLRTDNK